MLQKQVNFNLLRPQCPGLAWLSIAKELIFTHQKMYVSWKWTGERANIFGKMEAFVLYITHHMNSFVLIAFINL